MQKTFSSAIQIIRSKNNLKDKNSTYYLNSIIKQAAELEIEVDIRIANSQEEFTEQIYYPIPTLVLEPCEFVGSPMYNAESNQTARVCADYISVLSDPKGYVLVVSRSALIGRPLANILLDRDYTVMVAHSKTEDIYKLSMDASVIVTATGTNMLDNLSVSNKIIVDVSKDLPKQLCEDMGSTYVSMSEIGRATTEHLLIGAVELKGLIERHKADN